MVGLPGRGQLAAGPETRRAITALSAWSRSSGTAPPVGERPAQRVGSEVRRRVGQEVVGRVGGKVDGPLLDGAVRQHHDQQGEARGEPDELHRTDRWPTRGEGPTTTAA